MERQFFQTNYRHTPNLIQNIFDFWKIAVLFLENQAKRKWGLLRKRFF